jgi:hypothetical protein
MHAIKAVVEGLEDLFSVETASCEDEFQVLKVRIESLDEARPVLERLLRRVRAGVLPFDGAAVQVAGAANPRWDVRHRVTRDERDVLLSPEVVDEALLDEGAPCDALLCEGHAATYRQYLEDQQEALAFEPWQRYALLEEVTACDACRVETWVEITLFKDRLEDCFKEALAQDLPHLAGRLDGMRLLYWHDLDDLTARVAERPLETHGTVATWGKPCLVISSRNAENGGSAYFRSLATARAAEPSAVEPALSRLLDAPALDSILRAREAHVEAYPEAVGYLPPEYWLSADVLARVRNAEPLPRWFLRLAPLFVCSMLATVSSRVSRGEDAQNRLIFEIEREFALSLDCSWRGDRVVIHREDGEARVALDETVLSQLLDLDTVALQGKYTAVNRDLVQRSIVYGTGFAFESFFAKLNQIGKFYEFEYKHLLGDRFEQQSKMLSTFISDMVSLRQRLASLVESLSRDLSGLTTAVLATAVVSIVARTLDLQSWESVVIYGMATTPILVYVYFPLFFLRIDNLRYLGERAIDEFMRDLALSEEIWDFPLHTIGIEDEDLDRDRLLHPVSRQHRINEVVAIACGVVAHALFLALVAYRGPWWLLGPKLVLDAGFLGWAIWLRKYRRRLFYHAAIFLATLALAIAQRL